MFGGLARRLGMRFNGNIRLSGYLVARHIRGGRDRSLPEKGIGRSEVGERQGRDGRLVHREALYDPETDVAREKVVEIETGHVIVDKIESMKEKYERRGRWRPPQT